MTDIHSHILFDIDDGSKNLDMTLDMIKNAVKDGTKKIVATPHYCINYAEVPFYEVVKRVENLRQIIKENQIDIELFYGQEVYMSKYIVEQYNENKIGTINDTKYMLVELPLREIENDTLDMIYELQIKGIKIILAHPERYVPVINNPYIINDYVKEGLFFQMNAGSICGQFGKKVEKTADILLKNNIYSFIGSDAHDNIKRTTGLSKAINTIDKKKYIDTKLFFENAENMLRDKEVQHPSIIVPKKKYFFWRSK